MDKDLTDKLKKNIFYRAKIFIEQMGFFAPFGAKLIDEKIIDTMAYSDFRNNIPGLELVNMMKKNFQELILNNNIQAGAVAYDVVINIENLDGILEKRDALCIILTDDGKNWISEYFPYLIIDNQCVWK